MYIHTYIHIDVRIFSYLSLKSPLHKPGEGLLGKLRFPQAPSSPHLDCMCPRPVVNDLGWGQGMSTASLAWTWVG